jgi:hypothetical protein
LRLAVACAIVAAAAAGTAAMAEKTQTARFGVWKLQSRYDSFTGHQVCRLRTDYVDYDGHILSFHLNGNPPTVDAEFRINAGQVMHAADYQEAVESSLIFYHPGPLSSRDDGVLRLPARLFAEAAYVDLRADARAHSKHFNFDGFSAAVAYMRAHGCDMDDRGN